MTHSIRVLILCALVALLCACVSRSIVIESRGDPAPIVPGQEVDPHFEAVPGRGPEVIAALRAEPAPVRPQIVAGKNLLGDREALGALGFVHVGSSRFAADDPQAEEDAAALAARIGVERMLVYPRHAVDGGEGQEFLAVYYVRFKLLFGATFRNLTVAERESAGNDGGVQIGSVVGATPASDANLMAGDLVLRFNGRRFADRIAFQELLRNEAGKPVTLTIRRNGVDIERVVRLGAMPQDR